MNTRITYTHGTIEKTIVFPGTLTGSQKTDLVNNLDQGTFFNPQQVNVPSVTDHPAWHEMTTIEDTTDPATDTRSIHLVYTAIVATEWNPNTTEDLWTAPPTVIY